MKAHPAQDNNLEACTMLRLMRTAAHVLNVQADDAERHGPTRARRDAMRQVLAGVVADIEKVRYALK